jgi:hypothetical protein
MSDISRRFFLGTVGATAAGTMLAGEAVAATGEAQGSGVANSPLSPGEVKVNVKQVMAGLLHSGAWYGPCRWKPPIPPEQERAQAQQRIQSLLKSHQQKLSPEAHLMPPTYVEYWEDFHLREEELQKLDADAADVDLYLVSSNNTAAMPAAIIGERYKKPTVIVDGGADSVDLAGFLNGSGMEGELLIDYEDLNHCIRLLKARKTMRQTHLLMVTDRGLPPMGVQSTIIDLKTLADKFGIRTTHLNLKEVAPEMERVMADAQCQQQAEQMADALVSKAAKTWVERKYVVASCLFYRTISNLMQKHSCNAFTIECFEFCSSRLPEKWKITPCLTHSLFKDQGLASACECDLSALLTMRLLMSVADRAAFMGNFSFIDEQTVNIWHSVPSSKMAGFDALPMVYQLGHFTPAGWGTKVQVPFHSLPEKTVTIARLNRRGDRLGVGVGEIAGTKNFDTGEVVGCTLGCLVRVPDARKFFHKQGRYGNHQVAVYGNHLEALRELGEMIGVEVEQTA